MVTYGICQHHVTDARIMVKTGQLNHDSAMRLLKVIYEVRNSMYGSSHTEDK